MRSREASLTESSGAFDAYRATKYFANLDGLRFICIFAVLWHHAPAFSPPDIQLDNRGFLGVDFFFVLSGYLITTLLLREAAQYGSFSLRDFYIRRAVRILPVYFLVVTCVSFYYIVLKGEHQYLELLPFYYLFLSNFLIDDIPLLAVSWSLSMEEQYYLLWPLLLLLLPQRWVVPVLTGLIAINVLVITDLIWSPEPIQTGPLWIDMPKATYVPILMGSLAAVLLHYRRSFEWLWPLVSHWAASVLAVVGLVVALELLPPVTVGFPNLVIHSLMTLILITLVVQDRTPFSGFLTHPLIVRIGAISYGVYLYHLLALDVVVRVLTYFDILGPVLVFVVYTIVSCIISEISFRTFEAYFHRFRPRPRSATVARLSS